MHIIGDQQGMMRGGSMEPSGYGHITSIERFTAEANKKYAPEICQHFQSILGIPTNRYKTFLLQFDKHFIELLYLFRISIVLHDVPGSSIVSDGKTKG